MDRFPPPCRINLHSTKAIIQHFQDLILFEHFLVDYNNEMLKFIQELKEFGWGDDEVRGFIEKAGYGTFYEKLIEPPLPSLGDRKEFEKNKARWRK